MAAQGNSPSWFNADEAALVRNYVERLLDTRRNPIRASEIGIITPYAKQKQKLRQAIYGGGARFSEIKVGSTEEFQGQERRVIIISTVRSSDRYIEHDHKFKLGFLVNEKRFNVAITRAQALLIIIGNPKVLASDPHWAALLQSCVARGAYTGDVQPPQSVNAGGGGQGVAAAAEEGGGPAFLTLEQAESLLLTGDEELAEDAEEPSEVRAAPTQRPAHEAIAMPSSLLTANDAALGCCCVLATADGPGAP